MSTLSRSVVRLCGVCVGKGGSGEVVWNGACAHFVKGMLYAGSSPTTNHSPHKILTRLGKFAQGHIDDRGDRIVPDGERGRLDVPALVLGVRRDDRLVAGGRPRVAAIRSSVGCVGILHNGRHLPAVVRAGDGLLEVRVQLGCGREPLPGSAGLRSRLGIGDLRAKSIATLDFSNCQDFII